MGRVVVLGSINRDLVLSVSAHPRPGETVAGSDLREYPGGKGANQAVAARRAGATSMLIGAIGQDGFGMAMRDFLAGEGVDLSGLRIIEERPTGMAMITLDSRGENAIVVSAGANAALAPADLAALALSASDHVLAQFEVPEAFIRAGFVLAREAGAVTILNPAPMKALGAELLALTDVLVLNETELESASGSPVLADEAAIADAARQLATARRSVVVTLGARGCLAITPQALIRIPGEKVEAIDTTGAGDCFAGVFAAALAGGLAFEKALVRAGKAAALSVTRPGAATSMPYARELD